MKVVKVKSDLASHIKNVSVGFVPTMGALHEGHMSLIKESKRRNLLTVASIFINPTQFNNVSDFEKYPIDIEGDCAMLERAGCDILFLPSVDEIYTLGVNQHAYTHDFGRLENLYEGHYRPGHFKGVGQVVHILFEIVQPRVAFFGEKDLQQLAIIRQLVNLIQMEIEIVGMPTVRESDGLAMSSRNRRLMQDQRTSALKLFKALTFVKNNWVHRTREELINQVNNMFINQRDVRLEYFDIVNDLTFEPSFPSIDRNCRAVIAAYVGEIRLIDNMLL